jgi:hypothetical protein
MNLVGRVGENYVKGFNLKDGGDETFIEIFDAMRKELTQAYVLRGNFILRVPPGVLNESSLHGNSFKIQTGSTSRPRVGSQDNVQIRMNLEEDRVVIPIVNLAREFLNLINFEHELNFTYENQAKSNEASIPVPENNSNLKIYVDIQDGRLILKFDMDKNLIQEGISIERRVPEFQNKLRALVNRLRAELRGEGIDVKTVILAFDNFEITLTSDDYSDFNLGASFERSDFQLDGAGDRWKGKVKRFADGESMKFDEHRLNNFEIQINRDEVRGIKGEIISRDNSVERLEGRSPEGGKGNMIDLVLRSAVDEDIHDISIDGVDFVLGVRREDIVQKVVDVLKVKFDGGSREVILKLEPEELGRIIVRISELGDKVNILLEVENMDVKRFVEANIQNLRSSLELNRVNVEQLNVALLQGGYGWVEEGFDFHGMRREFSRQKFEVRRKFADGKIPVENRRLYGNSLIEVII